MTARSCRDDGAETRPGPPAAALTATATPRQGSGEELLDCALDTAVFNEATSRVAQAVPKRPGLPILRGIALIAEADTLTALAGDYDLVGRASVPVRLMIPGRALVDGRLLDAIARHLPGPVAELKMLPSQHLQIRSGPSLFRLLTMPFEEYPARQFGRLADQRNRAGSVKPAKPVPAWRPTRTPMWSPPSRSRAPFRPEPFGRGDWVRVTDPWTAATYTGQVWTTGWLVVDMPEGHRLLEIHHSRGRGGLPWIRFSRQNGTDASGRPHYEHRTAVLERLIDPDPGGPHR